MAGSGNGNTIKMVRVEDVMKAIQKREYKSKINEKELQIIVMTQQIWESSQYLRVPNFEFMKKALNTFYEIIAFEEYFSMGTFPLKDPG